MSLSTSTKTGTVTTIALALSAAAAAAAFFMQRQAGPPDPHACVFHQRTGIHSSSPSRACLQGLGGCNTQVYAQRPWCEEFSLYETIYQCLEDQLWTANCGAAIEELRVRGAFIPAGFVTPAYGPIGGYAPGYIPGYAPGYAPGYTPGYVPGYQR